MQSQYKLFLQNFPDNRKKKLYILRNRMREN